MNAVKRVARIVALLYGSWLLMLALHECGHVMHAYVSGGRVQRVSIPFDGFSETFYSHNPHPRFVSCGGPLWGVLLPLVLLALLHRSFARRHLQFFAGFCLIANGAYIGVGWIERVGDAGDLLSFGVPLWTLILLGVVSCGYGFWLWHRLGKAGRRTD